MKLAGIFPPVTTPFDHAGEIYKVKVQHNIDKWNRTTLSGYVVGGSTGETPFLSAEEKVRMWEWVAEYSSADKLLIAGTGVEGVRETIALTKRAAEIGYKVALVLTPHYYKGRMSQPAAQMLYYRSVADHASIPVMLYNLPQNTGIDLPAETIVALSEHPNIIGIKESSGNIGKMMQIIREAKPGFQLLTGAAQVLAPALSIGAVGGILAVANAIPYAAISIWEAHRTRETQAALDWQNRIGRASEIIATKHGIAGLKYAMDLNGYYGGPPRLPLSTISPEARIDIEKAFDGIKG